MLSLINQTLFSEPSGRAIGLVNLCVALLLSGMYGYFVILLDYTPGSFILFIIAGMALSGIAESLPKARRRTTGVLRLTAFSVLVSLLVGMFLVPELLTG